jgi:hypothetical protein
MASKDFIGPVVIEGKDTGDKRIVEPGAVSMKEGTLILATVYEVDPDNPTTSHREHLKVGVVTAMTRRDEEVIVTGRITNSQLMEELLGVTGGRIPATADLSSCIMAEPEMVEVDGEWVVKDPGELQRVTSCELVGITLNRPGDADVATWVDWA